MRTFQATKGLLIAAFKDLFDKVNDTFAPKFVHNIRAVHLYGSDRPAELSCDLLVCQALHNKLKYILFRFGKQTHTLRLLRQRTKYAKAHIPVVKVNPADLDFNRKDRTVLFHPDSPVGAGKTLRDNFPYALLFLRRRKFESFCAGKLIKSVPEKVGKGFVCPLD